MSLNDEGDYDEVIINTTLEEFEIETIKLIERIDKNEKINK